MLAEILRYIREGWPNHVREELQPYWQRRLELSVLDDCILWGGRVLIPAPGRQHILNELHGGHPGSSRMKALARMFVWWVGMDKEVDQLVRRCTVCQQTKPMPPRAPLHPWQWPTRPWARIHVDFAGPIQGRMFLVLVDAHSKWIEVRPMGSTTATATIERLRSIFAQHGIPETIVSDKGPQFTAEEFRKFCHQNGIHQVSVAPYHPSSNGLAERAVQIFKQGLKKMSEGSLEDRLSRLLFSYRITPHSTTGRSPAELLLGRQLRSRLDLLRPDLSRNVEQRQDRQKLNHDRKSSSPIFQEGEEVYVRNYSRQGSPWWAGRIEKRTGPVSAQVEVEGGILVRRHFDQIRKRWSDTTGGSDMSDMEEVGLPDPTSDSGTAEHPAMEQLGAAASFAQVEDEQTSRPNPTPGAAEPSNQSGHGESGPPKASQSSTPTRRYPNRTRKPPERLQL